ncbi:hypothetical protein [Zeimonas arvi]|uniref:Uncharacterized protein n=1 Tax=Zeimonas arvi TaxID=2498847 RepID=A0A5C8NVM4_9BURK|nr:hypothetical protein [Zeimonas arvi]TXL65258.1 hypothetical protein FHP08_10675 [Zeimonas arvi]
MQDEALAQMRGGLDLGVLIANFSIERLVRIDGEVVSRSRLVLSEVANLSRGQAPRVELAGNLANLIQIGQNNTVVAQDGVARILDQAGVDSVAPTAPGGRTSAAAGAALGFASRAIPDAAVPPAAPSQGAAPTASGSAGASSSAMGQFGPGLAAGVNAANGELPGRSASAPGAALPVANAAPAVTVSNLPDAAAMMTTIQNSVAAIRIDTETRIQATMSSLAALRASHLASFLQQQQALDALRR